MQILGSGSIKSEKRLNEKQRQVVAGNRLRDAVVINSLQIQITRSIPTEVKADKHRQPRAETLNVGCFAANDVAILGLLDQSLTKVRTELESVIAVKRGKG